MTFIRSSSIAAVLLAAFATSVACGSPLRYERDFAAGDDPAIWPTAGTGALPSVPGEADEVLWVKAPGEGARWTQDGSMALALAKDAGGHYTVSPTIPAGEAAVFTASVEVAGQPRRAADGRLAALVVAPAPNARFYQAKAEASLVVRPRGTVALWRRGKQFIAERPLPEGVSWSAEEPVELRIEATRGSRGTLYRGYVDGEVIGSFNTDYTATPLSISLGSWTPESDADRPLPLRSFEYEGVPRVGS